MQEITAAELAKKISNGESLNIIDVRENEEVAQGKIPGAAHIPLGELPDHLDELSKDKQYYMVCRSGARSGRASAFLEAEGFHVINMTGGMLDWEDEVEV